MESVGEGQWRREVFVICGYGEKIRTSGIMDLETLIDIDVEF